MRIGSGVNTWSYDAVLSLFVFKKVQRKIKDAEAKAYIDPEMALQEKQKGNKLFTEGMIAS